MVEEAKTKIQAYRSRHTIYLQKELVNDSAFPFKIGEELVVSIKGKTLVIKKSTNSK